MPRPCSTPGAKRFRREFEREHRAPWWRRWFASEGAGDAWAGDPTMYFDLRSAMAIATTNPATGDRLRTFAAHSPDEVEQRVARAHTQAASWRATPMSDRTAVVARAGEILDAEREAFGRLMTLEMGKTLRSAIDEAAKCASACRYFAEHTAGFLADAPVAVDGEHSYVAFQPLGVVLAIMPWNFPFWQVIRFAAPALCAGNVGLLKHASNVPQCALALEKLFQRAGAPRGVFQTLLIGSERVEDLLADPRIAAVTLTGSEPAGASVAAAAGRSLKKTVLELGGSDPFIVMPSADLDAAVATAVKARIINNGQSCIAAKRFIVHEAIYDAFQRRFTETMRALRVGDPMDAQTDVGPLATQQLRDDLHAQVLKSVAAGAQLLTGGVPRPGPGWYYEPTILTDVPPSAPAACDELFGPVASLFRTSSADDAVRIANASPFGLAASAWTHDTNEANLFNRDLDVGGVFINAMVASDARFPFGGVKRSGYGRELSEFGIREFVNIKTVRVKGLPA